MEKTTRHEEDLEKPDFIDRNVLAVDFPNRRIGRHDSGNGAKNTLGTIGTLATTAVMAPVLVLGPAASFMNNLEKMESDKTTETKLPEIPGAKSTHDLIRGFGKKPWDASYVDKVKDTDTDNSKSR